MSIFTKFSLKNALIIFLIVVFLIGYGIYSTTTIQQELMPNISIPFVSVVTVYPGAAPDDVAEAISRPIGKAVSGIQGIKQINTTSNENYSLVMVNFSYSKDMEKAEQEVQDAINKVKLPDKAQKPNVTKFSYGSIPVVSYTVTSQKDENELSKIIKDKVQPELSGIKGVGRVNVSGIKEKNVFIRVDDAKLKENGISLQDIQQTLAANDISFPVGTVDITGQTIPLKITRKVSSLNDLKSIPIIIQPNSTKLLGEMIGKTASGMKDGMSSAISAMQEGMTNAISGMQEGFGKAIAGNTQAIGCLYAIQSSQAMILNQREKVLGNPASKPEDIIKAKMIIEQATKTIAQNQATLNTIMKNAMAASKAQNAMPKQASGGRKIPIAPAPNNNASDGLSLNSSNSYQIKTVFLGDIAEIKYDTLDEGVYTRANLKPTVILTIYKNETDNAVEIEKSVREKIKEITLANPDIDMIKIDDSARYITSSINGMVREGLLGALFAILIIALFLRNIRATIIAFISIPLSILIALILMPMLGVSLNMMSLSGMAVATGRIVDDSIVVIENIFRRLQLRKADEKNILLDST
ncbi:MAG: efflux RND transporter permease subunit, partial [Bacillota bacterium]|nr:efflux RND transporter permease subunit [Bacillota bacterium]